jgi:hypothetical protein
VRGDVLASSSSGTHNPTPATSNSPDRGAVTSGGVVVRKKRTAALSGLDSSPGSVEDVEDAEPHEERKRQPVKRACNECRQQKVRVQNPARWLYRNPRSKTAAGITKKGASGVEKWMSTYRRKQFR